MTAPTSRFAAVLLACASLAASAARAQEEPGDGDDVLWAGDDAWSTPGQIGTDVATIPADEAGSVASAQPPDDWAGDDRREDGYDGYLRDAHAEIAQTTAPRYADFQQGLSPYGEWVDTPEYGRVWRPTQVSTGWRPYSDGRWVYTRYGWTWVADEPFGWAVYHYGRWWYSPAFGWSWVPGRVWGPAWVSWRYGGGNCGWAPLGPRGVVYVEPTRWVFVPTVHFVHHVRTYAIPVHRTYAVWSQVSPLPVQRPGPRAGPPVQTISRAVGHSIRTVPIAVSRSQAAAPRSSQPGAGVVHIYRPAGVPFRAAAAAAKARPRWHEVTPAAPAGGQPSAPVQRQPQIRSPRTGSLPRSTEPRQPQTRAAPVERKPSFGGVPSPGIIERNRQRREEQRAQREERQQARNEQRVQRREERPRAEAARREEHQPSNGGQRTAKPAKKDDRDAKERNKH